MVDKPTYNGLFENSKKLAERVSDLERKLLIQSNTWITKDAGRLFSELFNKAGDIILLHKMGENNQPGTILMANPAAIRILGYSEDELNEMTLNDLIEKETKEFNQDELHFKEILKFERILLNKDRQRLFVEVHTHEFKQDEEQRAFTIIYDVTDRRLMLEALRVSEGKYKRLVESLSNEYIFYSHNKDGMITYISPSIEKVLGYSQEEASRNYKEFLTPHEMNIKSLEHSEQSIKGMVQPPFMNELYHRDGSTRIFYNTEIPVFDEKGEVIAVEGISKDITEWKKIEDDLRKSESDLKEANVAKDKFFSIIAHDLKNPFHTIRGFSDLLLKHIDSYDKEEILTFITMIHDASRQAYNLLENLLHWSRAQTGRMEVNPSGFDLHEIIEENIRLLGGNASEKNISLISKIYQGTLVYGDANMISTVIRNLISNAIKYTKPTGKVTLKSRLKGDTMEIAITDTGVGIKKEDLSKLFRIDTNFTTSGTANEEGTGLGLSLCKEFIDINNGTIKVDSKPGKGTTFYVNLPKPK